MKYKDLRNYSMSNLKALRELINKSKYPEIEESELIDGEVWITRDNGAFGKMDDYCQNPITLAEILMALGKLEINWYSAFNQKTMHILGYSLKNPETVIADFALHMDKNLDDQSPETIQNLLTLMKKHND